MKKLLMLFFLAGAAWGQGAPISGMALNRSGQPVPQPSVYICTAAATGTPCSPQAAIYSDQAMSQPITQPLIGDAYGNFNAWAPGGLYEVQVTAQGATYSYYVNTGSGVNGQIIMPSDFIPSAPVCDARNATCGTVVAGAADSQPQVQSIFTYLGQTGREARLPLGTVNLGSPVTSSGNGAYRLYGLAGEGSLNAGTTFKFTGSQVPGFTYAPVFDLNGNRDCELGNFNLDMAFGASDGVSVRHSGSPGNISSHCLFENIQVFNVGSGAQGFALNPPHGVDDSQNGESHDLRRISASAGQMAVIWNNSGATCTPIASAGSQIVDIGSPGSDGPNSSHANNPDFIYEIVAPSIVNGTPYTAQVDLAGLSGAANTCYVGSNIPIARLRLIDANTNTVLVTKTSPADFTITPGVFATQSISYTGTAGTAGHALILEISNMPNGFNSPLAVDNVRGTNISCTNCSFESPTLDAAALPNGVPVMGWANNTGIWLGASPNARGTTLLDAQTLNTEYGIALLNSSETLINPVTENHTFVFKVGSGQTINVLGGHGESEFGVADYGINPSLGTIAGFGGLRFFGYKHDGDFCAADVPLFRVTDAGGSLVSVGSVWGKPNNGCNPPFIAAVDANTGAALNGAGYGLVQIGDFMPNLDNGGFNLSLTNAPEMTVWGVSTLLNTRNRYNANAVITGDGVNNLPALWLGCATGGQSAPGSAYNCAQLTLASVYVNNSPSSGSRHIVQAPLAARLNASGSTLTIGFDALTELLGSTNASIPYAGTAVLDWQTDFSSVKVAPLTGTTIAGTVINASSGFQVNGAAFNFSHLAGTASAAQLPTTAVQSIGTLTAVAGHTSDTISSTGVTRCSAQASSASAAALTGVYVTVSAGVATVHYSAAAGGETFEVFCSKN